MVNKRKLSLVIDLSQLFHIFYYFGVYLYGSASLTKNKYKICFPKYFNINYEISLVNPKMSHISEYRENIHVIIRPY